MPEAGELSLDGEDRSSRARNERRLRLCIVATGTVATASFAVFAITGDEAPPHEISAAHFLGFWVFLHSALTFLVLCVVAVLLRVIASDATDSERPNAATAALDHRGGGRAGTRPGLSRDERARLAEPERENRELRRSNENLKSAAASFGAELGRRPKK